MKSKRQGGAEPPLEPPRVAASKGGAPRASRIGNRRTACPEFENRFSESEKIFGLRKIFGVRVFNSF